MLASLLAQLDLGVPLDELASANIVYTNYRLSLKSCAFW